MGLESLWNADGNYLKSRKEGFRVRSTGCSCCSIELTTEKDVKKEALDSLVNVLEASWLFKWDFLKLVNEARKELKAKRKKYAERKPEELLAVFG